MRHPVTLMSCCQTPDMLLCLIARPEHAAETSAHTCVACLHQAVAEEFAGQLGERAGQVPHSQMPDNLQLAWATEEAVDHGGAWATALFACEF